MEGYIEGKIREIVNKYYHCEHHSCQNCRCSTNINEMVQELFDLVTDEI